MYEHFLNCNYISVVYFKVIQNKHFISLRTYNIYHIFLHMELSTLEGAHTHISSEARNFSRRS